MSQIAHFHFQIGDHVLKSWPNCISFLTRPYKIYYFNLNFQATSLIKITTYHIWKVQTGKSHAKIKI